MADRNQTTSEITPEASPQAEAGAGVNLPDDAALIIAVRSTVLFPEAVLPISLGRKKSILAAQEAVRSERPLGILLQKTPEIDEPEPEHLYRIGTMANILRYVTAADGGHHMICQGRQRFRIIEFLKDLPFLAARVEEIEEKQPETTEVEARMHLLKQRAVEAVSLLPQAPAELAQAIEAIESASALADIITSFIDVDTDEKQTILETINVTERLDKVIALLAHRIEVLRLSQEIGQQTKAAIDERQREYLLREQLKTIQRELGEGDGRSAEVEELDKAITEAGMPEEAEEQARKELKRLERMPEAAAEYSIIRTYLDWLVELPWSKLSEGRIDIDEARRILDEDHYGLEKVKRRILEHLAVRKLNPEGKAPILCFVGPPGVGKTSLGKSIARATGREFIRASLGGVHDESEIRGHRRTYIGAMPGTVIQSIRKAGTRNPVFMLDEIDKLGAGFHGDPSSALLEVLDPQQNSTFRDNYLGVTFDLSRVMFIATANVIDAVPRPLRDRMEVIELPGYTDAEKLQIARRYLVGRQLEDTGLKGEQLEVSDEALHAIIRDYTREAGVRNLEREIGNVCRWAAMKIAEGAAEMVRVGPDELPEILGPRKFEREVAMRTSVPGVATGLAWTPVGGEILFVEASRVPGGGRLILTGQLGDVMKESAQAAVSLVKSRAEELGVTPEMFEKSDIHVHVPAGAIPKDGPSAGVAMYVALASLLTGKTVHSDVAMTGEISLRGLVLPVGGIKEKVVAAVRAGISHVVLPARNRKDFEEIPEDARKSVTFTWVDQVDEAARAAIGEAADATHGGETAPPEAMAAGGAARTR